MLLLSTGLWKNMENFPIRSFVFFLVCSMGKNPHATVLLTEMG